MEKELIVNKVFMIVGLGRSGTTIIGKKLSEYLGGIFLGELIYFSSRGIENKSLCGCGEYASNCEFWKRIIDSLSESEKRILKEAEEDLRLKNIIKMKNFKKYKDLYERVHNLISDNKPLVDSSKIFPYAFMFRKNPNYVFIHIIRDPISVTSSMMSKKFIPELGKEEYLHNGGLIRTPLRWSLVNLLVKAFIPIKHTIFYEDFVSDHSRVFEEILKKGQDQDSISGHSLAGNPSRFGDQTIKAQTLKREFTKYEKILISLLSWPARKLIKYS